MNFPSTDRRPRPVNPADAGLRGASEIGRPEILCLEFFVWTINDVATARKFAELGVDGITTDRAAWLKEQLAK